MTLGCAMSLEAKIVGFDRASDRATVEVDLPARALEAVRKIADVPSSDPDILGSYPLNERQIAMIAEVAHITIDSSKCRYFLEAYEEEAMTFPNRLWSGPGQRLTSLCMAACVAVLGLAVAGAALFR